MAPHTEDTDEPTMRGENTYAIPHIDLLTWLFSNDQYDHDKPIFVDANHPERSMSTNEAKKMVKRMIAGLKSIGVKPGDAVCIHSFNDIFYPIIFLAIIGVGGIFVGTNPGYTVFELNHHLRISHSKFVIAQPGLMGNLKVAAELVGIDASNIIAFDTPGQTIHEGDGLRSFKELLGCGEHEWIEFDDENTAKTTLMGLFASSGTTGMPKVIAISHFAWVAGSVLLRDNLERPYEVKRLMCLPSFHGFAAPLTIGVPLRMGQTTFILPRFELNPFCDAVENHGINETAVAPPCLQAFLKLPPETKKKLESIKRVWCGGAPMNIKLQTESRNCFAPDAEIVNIWGMTEIGISVGLRYDEIDRTGSASKLLPNTEARIINDSGTNVTHTGEEGEIQVRTPQSSLGYFGNAEATAETFLENGWVRTGDVAYFRDGLLYILDRKKEMIKVRGWQVAPAELEAVLVLHPGIKDAAVIGIKVGGDDDEHEVPRAYVVRMEGGNITEDEVKKFVSSKLSKYKALDGGVFFVGQIPKLPSGKILKKIIRAEWLTKEEQKPLA
ncbi:S-dihydroxybenzoyltransferase [Arthrobotrys entomopaga]|nr:S-dihydroxybenzoyltransferase [Arthrobotrys entomopaga]